MIKLFTDTSANLNKKTVEENNIGIIPFSYYVNGQENIYHDDFDGGSFYNLMRLNVDVTTSMINTARYVEYFTKELKKGNDILYIAMSGGISGAVFASHKAKEELEALYPDRKIVIINTCAASLGEGITVLYAAELLKEKTDLDEIERILNERIKRVKQYFTVEDLKYLKKGGRISSGTYVAGSLLNIKPILMGDEEGKIIAIGKVRGFNKALDTLADKYDKEADKSENIAVAHCDNKDGFNYLLNKLKEKGFDKECIEEIYEPVTGSHVGPGAVALFFIGK